MRTLFAFCALGLISTHAFASESYSCVGKDKDGKDATIEITFESSQKAAVTDMDGDDINLELNRTTTRTTVYGNYEYDGYGGSIELILPAKFTISGSNAAEEFKATYKHEIYSELGHVGSVGFKGLCERVDN